MTKTQQIALGGKKLGLPVYAPALDLLTEYLKLLEEANRVINLTSVPSTDWPVRHILDSLSIGRFIQGKKVADIGSGAGLPGIPLAIVRPDSCWTLIDKSEKKCSFLMRTKHRLKLKNVNIMCHRLESAPMASLSEKFDSVVARALGDTDLFCSLASPLLRAGGSMLYMRGRVNGKMGLSSSSAPTRHKLQVPFLEAQRHLDIWQKH